MSTTFLRVKGPPGREWPSRKVPVAGEWGWGLMPACCRFARGGVRTEFLAGSSNGEGRKPHQPGPFLGPRLFQEHAEEMGDMPGRHQAATNFCPSSSAETPCREHTVLCTAFPGVARGAVALWILPHQMPPFQAFQEWVKARTPSFLPGGKLPGGPGVGEGCCASLSRGQVSPGPAVQGLPESLTSLLPRSHQGEECCPSAGEGGRCPALQGCEWLGARCSLEGSGNPAMAGVLALQGLHAGCHCSGIRHKHTGKQSREASAPPCSGPYREVHGEARRLVRLRVMQWGHQCILAWSEGGMRRVWARSLSERVPWTAPGLRKSSGHRMCSRKSFQEDHVALRVRALGDTSLGCLSEPGRAVGVKGTPRGMDDLHNTGGSTRG